MSHGLRDRPPLLLDGYILIVRKCQTHIGADFQLLGAHQLAVVSITAEVLDRAIRHGFYLGQTLEVSLADCLVVWLHPPNLGATMSTCDTHCWWPDVATLLSPYAGLPTFGLQH